MDPTSAHQSSSSNGVPSTQPDEAELLAALSSLPVGGESLETTLHTDDQVIARVTDGIYRQPGSALRELISNAYDADATRVVIKTDRPRFERIFIEDNGNGMSTKALVRILYHIGGSAKRTPEGQALEISDSGDPNRSPGGRELIGKIGIGLFSVAQLTHSFQIITKKAGEDHRTVASVALRQYSQASKTESSGPTIYEAGRAQVWLESASDKEAHGTTIILDAIRTQTRETLQSRGTWDAHIGRDDAITAGSERTPVKIPDFHIGTVSGSDASVYRSTGHDRLPWGPDDAPSVAFRRLVDSVWQAVEQGNPNPRLEQVFDYYLTMIWQLSIWAPLRYVGSSPYELGGSSRFRFFDLNSDTAREFTVDDDKTVADATHAKLDPPEPGAPFDVFIDDLQLRRPVRFDGLPSTSAAVETPLLFVGSASYDFASVPNELSGGPLRFDGYIMWAPKIAPTDHQGVNVRVHDATGTMYDNTFLKFPVAEARRLSHMTCEIYIREGFDDALNIDRESFNFANPHVVVLTRWLHRALRKAIATEKRVAASARAARRERGSIATQTRANAVVERVWADRNDDDASDPIPVTFVDSVDRQNGSGYQLHRAQVLEPFVGPNSVARRESAEDELRNLLQLLAAFGALDRLTPPEVERLAAAMREVIRAYHP